jgi:tetratricopeptide (TPR) repeat protein
MCEQDYHGIVSCALGWACWKTYLGRPETDEVLGVAMGLLGSALKDAGHNEDALSVQEAVLSVLRRNGSSEENILAVQSNLATTYQEIGRLEEALALQREVYSVCLKLFGEHEHTLRAANNYACSLYELHRFKEAKELLRKTMPVARRILGEGHRLTLKMRPIYATVLCEDPAATLDDLREAVATLEDAGRIARQVLGGAHPLTSAIEKNLQGARAALRARETPSPPGSA